MNPSIVLIHGYLESPAMWDFLTLPTGLRSIRLTQPGHGPNDLPGTQSMTELAAAAISRINEAGVENFFLIGHSMGGYLAMEIASQCTERIAGLCLFHSTAKEDSEEKRERRTKAIELIERNREAYVRSTVSGLYATPNPEFIERQIDRVQTIRSEDLQHCLHLMRHRSDRIATATQLSQRLCYVMGSHDPLLPPDIMSSELQEVNPKSRHVIAGAGHMSHIEKPAEATEAILHWLSRVS